MENCPALPATGTSIAVVVALAAVAVVAGVLLIAFTKARCAVIVALAVVAVSIAGASSVDAATTCPPISTPAVAPAVPSATAATTVVAVPTTAVAPIGPATSAAAPTVPPTSSTSTSTTSTTSTTTSAPIVEEISLWFEPSTSPDHCRVWLGLSGWAPNTAYDVVIDAPGAALPAFQWAVVTDGVGNSVNALPDVESGIDYTGSLNGVTTGPVPVIC